MLSKDGIDPSRKTIVQARPRFFLIAASPLLVALLATIVAIPIAGSRNVAFYVNDKPVTEEHVSAMIVDLPFDETSNHYNTRLDLGNPSDPKMQYLAAGLKTEAIQRLIVMHAQSDEALRLGIVVSPSAIDAAVEAYVKDHASPDDTTETERLKSPDMRLYIQLWATSKAYEESLTKEATVSSTEVREYFATWGWNYTDAAGHKLTFEQGNARLTKDALANKKFQLILENRAQLLKKETSLVSGDTRYKRFMRWWDTMFGIQVPDSLEPLQVGAGS
ncbi:hypothetical protein [Candidatus Cryosericum odellii]|jgi:hypothetical protein|uniref:Uncharacterized protein n=1 Tax=Candidatus Cryosericum odellii TaxID=2290917 RepID=A0A398DGM5_9BACT|nr:hypothetical protein [Candidatus Cryosericum odellii]RIE10301.1 hypothetical protein SMC6_01590 [Candidatus Cryosericum odellii]RIE14952.1 hypothetical protein SMC5_01440 [Candidatus Cryosericum odellii]